MKTTSTAARWGSTRWFWKAKGLLTEKGPGLMLIYWSRDGEEGYPGNLSVTVTYLLTDANELMIHYQAASDARTPVNLTNHSYFNLAGQGNGDILKHELLLYADRYTPVDKGLIPTGELRSVAGTPFDFRKMIAIEKRIGQDDEQLKFGLGYDHNWVLNKKPGEMSLAARVSEPHDAPDDGGPDHGAGDPVLQRQLPRRLERRQGGQGVQASVRLLPGDAALPRLAQQAQLPLDDPGAGQRVLDDHDLPVLSDVARNACRREIA